MKHRYLLFFNSETVFSSHCHLVYVSVTTQAPYNTWQLFLWPKIQQCGKWSIYISKHVAHVCKFTIWSRGIYLQDSTCILLPNIIHWQTHSEMFGSRYHKLVCQGILWHLLPFTLLTTNHRQLQGLLCEGTEEYVWVVCVVLFVPYSH